MKKPPPLIYLDNNATTRVAPEVLRAMQPWLTENYGNPSSLYRLGRESALAIARARAQVAALLGASPDEILFTSCGTESDNLALHAALALTGKKHIVTTTVEHSAIRNPCRALEKRGYRVTWLPVDENGQLNLSILERAITAGTALVTVMWANNETGALFPVAEIAAICRRRGVLFHTDAVQAVGKIPIHAHKVGVDLLSISGHKFHAPKGVGALYARRGLQIPPLIHGGEQEHGHRGGTENVAGIVALGAAAKLALTHLDTEQSRVRQLRDQFEAAVLEKIPRVRINAAHAARTPNTTNLSFLGCEAEAILVHLDQHGICASSGSACATGKPEPSPVLTAMGLDPATARASVRFSFGRDNTARDVARTIEALTAIVAHLRRIGGS